MSNVVSFKPRNGGIKSQTADDVRQVTSIEETASVQMMQALLFYARSGWDGGEKAKKALIAMDTVMRSRETEPAIPA